MKITDINGNAIEVTNLEQAINQANEYRQCKPVNKGNSSFYRKQTAYWNDLHEKLIALKQTEHSSDKPVVTLHARPEMEYPVYNLSFRGTERFFQRADLMNSGYNWFEVVKTRFGWGSPANSGIEGNDWLGSTKAEATAKLIDKINKTL